MAKKVQTRVDAEEALDALEEEPTQDGPIDIDPEKFLSSGSTILNLACTDNPYACYAKGKYHFLVGDSMAGKTWFCLSALAEAGLRPDFDNHRFIYDNVEDGALMDYGFFFGKETAQRIEPPKMVDGTAVYSERVEDFYDNIDRCFQADRPFIYILDSMDALSSESEVGKVDEQRKAREKGKKVAGSYGDGKAKLNSSNLRTICRDLAKTDSILIIVSQTRDNIGFGFETKTRSGGHALRFYATLELWFSVAATLKKKIGEVDHPIGINTIVRAKKNRFTGKLRKSTVPIYYSYGMDDIGSCVDFLIKNGHWSAPKGTVKADEFGFSGRVLKLIEKIEKEDLEGDLQDLVSEVWDDIESKLRANRKRRY